jgi:quercetin dioxygenase-like cupin family protein
VTEARLDRTPHGLEPAGDGWFVLNARDARWEDSPFGRFCVWEGEESRFPQLGINVSVLEPGQSLGRDHLEPGHQEDFLVLRGTCVAIVEDEERELRAWDLLHCPPGVPHMVVAAGGGPAVVVSVGTRGDGSGISRGVTYPVSGVAARHGVSVERATDDPAEAYADVEQASAVPYGGWLDA